MEGGVTFGNCNLPVSMKQGQLMQIVSLAVAKQAIEFKEHNAERLLEVIDTLHSRLGHTIDVSLYKDGDINLFN